MQQLNLPVDTLATLKCMNFIALDTSKMASANQLCFSKPFLQ